MFKKLLIFLVFIITVPLLVFARIPRDKKTNTENPLGISTGIANIPSHPSIFFDEGTFYSGVEQAKRDSKPVSNHIFGGIIPHHLFPGFIIADFFARLTQQNPETIILIGPNHYEKGNFKALSSLYSWDTPLGVVEPEKSIIDQLLKDALIRIDENVLSNEHSVAGIMPFVKYYLPDSRVVPIILSGYMTQENTRTLSEVLKSYVNERTVIIAPVDFSHYLTNSEAQQKDEVTLEAMKNFDYRTLFSLNNDYLDSPASIATVLMVMENLGRTEMDILHHTNSGELQKNDSIGTTSYFSISYY